MKNRITYEIFLHNPLQPAALLYIGDFTASSDLELDLIPIMEDLIRLKAKRP